MSTVAVREYLLQLQQSIADTMQRLDGGTFLRDGWVRAPGERLQGDGLTLCIDDGALLERGGCNFSHVRGPQLPPSATQHRPELAGAPFEALGVSLVFHPRNPYVPTVHMNVRMFAALPAGKDPVQWFGGGMDLTPYYGFEDDARHFHRACRDALAAFGRSAPAFQALVRRVLLPQAPQRAARRRRHLLRRFLRARLRARLSDAALGGRCVPRRLRADRRTPARHTVRRARARVPGHAPWPLRGVQSGVRPRHAVRVAVGRAHREHPDVDAAARALGLQPPARSGHAPKRGCTATS